MADAKPAIALVGLLVVPGEPASERPASPKTEQGAPGEEAVGEAGAGSVGGCPFVGLGRPVVLDARVPYAVGERGIGVAEQAVVTGGFQLRQGMFEERLEFIDRAFRL